MRTVHLWYLNDEGERVQLHTQLNDDDLAVLLSEIDWEADAL